MSYVDINDLTIYYEISGSGPPLVLLPGLLGTLESDWRRFIPALETHYRIIAVDLRGHGRTNNPDSSGSGPGQLRIGQMVDDLLGLLDYLSLNEASVLGYSLGGCIGLAAGLKQPGKIKILVMHATKFIWDAASIEGMVSGMDPNTILEKNQRYAQTMQRNHSFCYGDQYWKVLLRTAARFVSTMPEEAPNFTQAALAAFPILVSVGDRDHLVSVAEAAQLGRALPAGQLLVLPNTRHAIHSVHSGPFLAAVEDFVGTG